MNKKMILLAACVLFLNCEWRHERQPRVYSIPIQYKTIVPVETNDEVLIPFSYGGKYGYANRALQVSIKPKFDKADHFTSDGFAIVSFGLLNPGIIDIHGNVIKELSYGLIRHIYDDIYHFSNMRSTDDEYIVGINDNRIIARQAGWSGITSKEGYLLATFLNEEKRYWFIDFDGNRVLTHLNMNRPSYSFFDQRARITDEEGNPRIIDMEGNIIGNLSFRSLGQRYSEGLIPAETTDGITGYIDKTGNFAFIIPFISDNGIPVATNFSGGYAAISDRSHNRRIVNVSGQIVSENLLVDDMRDFSDDLSLVSVFNPITNKTKYGYVNTKGEYLIRPVLESADDFKNGYSRIIYNGYEGLLKDNGKVIWSSDIMKGSPVENEFLWSWDIEDYVEINNGNI